VHFKRIDQRRVSIDLRAFPTREHDGQVVFGLGREEERGAVGEMQLDVAAQVNRAVAQPTSGGEHDASAAGATGSVDGGANRRQRVGAIGLRPIGGGRCRRREGKRGEEQESAARSGRAGERGKQHEAQRSSVSTFRQSRPASVGARRRCRCLHTATQATLRGS
jgi:hypothetical protein